MAFPTSDSASSLWTLSQARIYKLAGQWPSAPGVPSGLAVDAEGDQTLDISWTAGSGTNTDYVVEYTPSGGSASTVKVGSTATSYQITGLTNDTAYSVRVAGENGGLVGAFSAAVTGTPTATPTTGYLYAAGKNQNGMLGDGTTTNRTSPVQIGSDLWQSLAGGHLHALGIKADGTLWAWGNNTQGELGDGTLTSRTSPVQIGSDSWVSVVASNDVNVSAAIRADGKLYAWGYNGGYLLGDGTQTRRSSPTLIGGTSTWVAVSMRAVGGSAIKSDGTLWCWGYNANGEVGDGTTTTRTTPVQIGSDTDWAEVSCGGSHTVARKSGGEVYVWGYGGQGQTVNSALKTLSPTRVGTAIYTAIGSATNSSYAIKSDGTLWAWGNNSSRELGDGTTTQRSAPVQIGSATNWASVDGGGAFALGLRTDGALYGWGTSSYGSLGPVSTTSTPLVINSGTTYLGFSCGLGFSHRIRA